MALFNFDGYDHAGFSFGSGGTEFPRGTGTVGDTVQLDPAFDAASDRFQYEISDEAGFDGDQGASESGQDGNQYGTVRDADGNVVGGGSTTKIYLEDFYVLQAPDGSTITIYTVEIAGQPMGIVADAPLQPGVTYTIVDHGNVTLDNEPPYSDFGAVTYDPDVDNIIRGGANDDDLQGGAGADEIYTGAGNDIVSGGAGDDRITVNAGNDTVDGGAGSDHVRVRAETGDNDIRGGESADDADLLDFVNTTGSSTGATVTFTSDEGGTFSYDGGNTTGIFDEFEGIEGSGNADTIDASVSSADLFLDGDQGDDTLIGGSGDDTFVGGAGDDTITTGEGLDRIVIQPGSGTDTVTDFDFREDLTENDWDLLDTSQLTGGSGPGGQVLASDVLVIDDGSGNAQLIFPEGESVILQGLSPQQMQSQQSLMRAGVPCFTAGTLIDTPGGPRSVERLRPGDLVLTRDDGPQPVIWVGSRVLGPAELRARRNARPVRIAAGVFGNSDALFVSPQHRVLVRDPDRGGEEMLVRATHLARLPGGKVRIANGRTRVTYVHILLERHGVVRSSGLWSESFYPGRFGVMAMDRSARAEIASLFPDCRSPTSLHRRYGPAARLTPRFRDLPPALAALSPA